MKISVVMTTYNGEKYIYEQMKSIYEQTRQADEVIICDDCSVDRTAEIIRGFIGRYRLKHWKLIVNTQNKGWRRNFIEAIGMSSGTHIFFSDQDDVWYIDKIDIMMKCMERDPKIQCLSGRMVTIDKDGEVFEGKNAFSAGSGSEALIEYPCSENFNTITLLGCTMCITRSLADLVLQINVKEFGHDAQCCRLGVLLDGTYTLDRPVIKYRLHSGNTSGVVSGVSFGSATLQKRIQDIEKNIVWLEALLKNASTERFIDKEKENLVRKTIEFQTLRKIFLKKRSIIPYLKLIRYRKYYAWLSMYVGDFAYAFHINKISGNVLWRIRNRNRE